MDFHKLTRRELQALCKMNKIPANMTNIAMADALKGLDVVQGIQDYFQPSWSETAESSVESTVKIEVTSPYIPPTGGRSRRRGNVAKVGAETMKSITRARTERKEAVETSSFKTSSSQLKECVEDEKKDLLTTPAQLGISSRTKRSVKEDSVAEKLYGTRRSMRLAEKSIRAVNNVFQEDVLAKNVMENVIEGFDDFQQMSGTRGEEFKPVEDNSGGKYDADHVSSQDLGASVCKERWLGCLVEERESDNNIEANGSMSEVKIDIHLGTEEYQFDLESKAGSGSMKCDGEKDLEDDCTITLLTESSQAQDINGTYSVLFGTEESEFDFEESAATVGDELSDLNMVVPIVEVNESHDVEGVSNHLSISESKITFGNTTTQITDEDECPDFGESSDIEMEPKEPVNGCPEELNFDLPNKLEADEELISMMCDAISVKAIDGEVKQEDADGIMIVQAEEDNKEIVPSDVAFPAKQLDVDGEKGFTSQLELNTVAFEEKDRRVVGPIPIKGNTSSGSSTKKGVKYMVSDNKENIDSAGKLVLTKERVQMVKKKTVAPKLDDLSIGKLSKMLKAKLQIRNAHYKNEKNGDEVPVIRPALQAFPENWHAADRVP